MRTASIPRAELDDLLDAYRAAPAPTVTAYVPTDSAVEDAAERAALQVAAAVAAAEERGASPALCQALRDVLTDAGHTGGDTLVAVVREDGPSHVWRVSEDVPQPQVHVGVVPHIGQLIAWRQQWVPHVAVLTDRVGADITAVGAGGDAHDATVDGATSHIHRGHPGGWSQRRFQQRAEEHWEDNAQQVAERVAAEANRVDAAVVLVSGDQRAIGFLEEHLPTSVADRLQVVEAGGRSADSSEEATAAAMAAAVKDFAAQRRLTLQRRVKDAVGERRGTTVVADVLQALFSGTAEAVVVQLDSTDARTAWVGGDPTQVAAQQEALTGLGLEAHEVPLTDAALRGAAATGAELCVMVKSLADFPDGVAASLLTGPDTAAEEG